MKKLLLIFVFSIAAAALSSQSLIPTVVGSAGSSGTSASGNIDWTIGELMTETFSGGNFLTQGFHQPWTSITTAIPEVSTGEFIVYPNPTTDELNVSVTAGNGNYFFDLFDIQGRKVLSGRQEISGPGKITLSLERLSPGIYHFHLYRPDASKKSFIISKTK
jgi:hypothetical protein